MSKQEFEMVLAIDREVLTEKGIGYDGVYPLDISTLDQYRYIFLPRALADDKKHPLYSDLAARFPQMIPYVMLRDAEGRYMVYQRSGKEPGLLGKWSVGVGGHIDINDRSWLFSQGKYLENAPGSEISTGLSVETTTALMQRVELNDLISTGYHRELLEETGLRLYGNFTFQTIISSNVDQTAEAHIGLLEIVDIENYVECPKIENLDSVFEGSASTRKETLRFSPLEYHNVTWKTRDELLAMVADENFTVEPWSMMVIENYLT